jgi:cytochrome P450
MTLADHDFLARAFTPEYQDDPYPLLHQLRSASPVLPTPFGSWLVSRYADIAPALRDARLSNDERHVQRPPELFSSGRADIDQGVMLFMDPPDHTRLRGLVSKAFTPRTVERLRPRVQNLVDRLLDDAMARREGLLDVVTDLAYPLPVVVICELLGVPPSDHPTFQAWSRELAASLDPAPLHTAETERRIRTAADEFSQYFDELLRRRRRSPRDDLLSGLIAAEQDGARLSPQELRNTGMFLLVAGHETTVNLIGNSILALLRKPDQLARLRDDPALTRPAIDELLRYDSPVQLTQRITVSDYEIGGVTVPAHQQLVLLLGAANRDPAQFPEPDHLDLGRAEASRHLAFGGVPHFCLGASLARLEGEIAIATMVRRFPGLELAGDPVRRHTFTLRGLDHLPVATGSMSGPRSWAAT